MIEMTQAKSLIGICILFLLFLSGCIEQGLDCKEDNVTISKFMVYNYKQIYLPLECYKYCINLSLCSAGYITTINPNWCEKKCSE